MNMRDDRFFICKKCNFHPGKYNIPVVTIGKDCFDFSIKAKIDFELNTDKYIRISYNPVRNIVQFEIMKKQLKDDNCYKIYRKCRIRNTGLRYEEHFHEKHTLAEIKGTYELQKNHDNDMLTIDLKKKI